MEHVGFGLGLVGQPGWWETSLLPDASCFVFLCFHFTLSRSMDGHGFYFVTIKKTEAREEKKGENLLGRSIKYPGNLNTSAKPTGSVWTYCPHQ